MHHCSPFRTFCFFSIDYDRILSYFAEKFEYWNDVEFNDENYETGYVPELNNGTTGSKTNDNNDEASELISGTLDSETNDTNDEVSELNGDGANSVSTTENLKYSIE